MHHPSYKRLLAEEKFQHHMTRRELANYSCVPMWVVKLCRMIKRNRRPEVKRSAVMANRTSKAWIR
jgi:hypothetical protein